MGQPHINLVSGIKAIERPASFVKVIIGLSRLDDALLPNPGFFRIAKAVGFQQVAVCVVALGGEGKGHNTVALAYIAYLYIYLRGADAVGTTFTFSREISYLLVTSTLNIWLKLLPSVVSQVMVHFPVWLADILP